MYIRPCQACFFNSTFKIIPCILLSSAIWAGSIKSSLLSREIGWCLMHVYHFQKRNIGVKLVCSQGNLLLFINIKCEIISNIKLVTKHFQSCFIMLRIRLPPSSPPRHNRGGGGGRGSGLFRLCSHYTTKIILERASAKLSCANLENGVSHIG